MLKESQNDHRLVGHRVRARRKQQRFSQTRLAQISGTSCSQVSAIEHDQGGISLRNTIAIIDALTTSLDYLLGRVDDPRPVREMTSELQTKRARILDLEEGHAEPLDPNWQEHVGIDLLNTTVGADGAIRDEIVIGRLKFPYTWLRKHGLRAHTCQIVRMTGEAMEPTIPDGSAILVDTAATDPRDGSVVVVRIADQRVVRRLTHDPEAGWLLSSDNPNRAQWSTEPSSDNTTIIGEVKWLGRTLTKT